MAVAVVVAVEGSRFKEVRGGEDVRTAGISKSGQMDGWVGAQSAGADDV